MACAQVGQGRCASSVLSAVEHSRSELGTSFSHVASSVEGGEDSGALGEVVL